MSHTATATSSPRPRNARLDARVSSEQKGFFMHAANLSGRTLSEFVIDSAQEAADRIVREHEIVRLSREEQIAFVSALLDPPEVSELLRRAVADYRRKVGV
ncbi:hypothetical protein AGMMS49960_00240 [Betaproteobacteria bacterium]|nr:hypothetical protein AGMMS49960_00240 [Betaproteobacteria bacterium]GHU18748.1 hypothetical protein AGMMS50243_09330 [Betaproteobacteria bacterium]